MWYSKGLFRPGVLFSIGMVVPSPTSVEQALPMPLHYEPSHLATL